MTTVKNRLISLLEEDWEYHRRSVKTLHYRSAYDHESIVSKAKGYNRFIYYKGEVIALSICTYPSFNSSRFMTVEISFVKYYGAHINYFDKDYLLQYNFMSKEKTPWVKIFSDIRRHLEKTISKDYALVLKKIES